MSDKGKKRQRKVQKFEYFEIEIIFLGNIKKALSAPQSAITCSKLTIETLEQGVKYVQS